MSLAIGIVGMPNAGKSSLFNLITGLSVPAENYPFNTITPNLGIVAVKDERILKIAELVGPEKIAFPQVEFHDIAGLVKGASKGEGLGNKFLANIREVDLVLLVLRGFRDGKVEHTLGSIDPKRDREVLEAELILKDIETVGKRIDSLARQAKTNAEAKQVLDFFQQLLAHLNNNQLGKDLPLPELEAVKVEYQSLQLLTAKPFVYLVNTDEFAATAAELRTLLGVADTAEVLAIDVQLEKELANNPSLLSEFGLTEPVMNRLIKTCFAGLDYMIFITAGKPEVRGWPIKNGTQAQQAAGVIHTDFIKKFIAAEVASYEDFVSYNGWEGLKQAGKVKLVGKDYLMVDGDVVYFRIGA